MSNTRLQIYIEGIVQGVGFRPFIYRLARKYNLNGWVRNTTEGVEMEVEGESENLKDFPKLIKKKAPPLARIKRIISKYISVKGDSTFTIKESNKSSNTIAMIPPDVSICSNCVKDITNPNNRRYRYPFTNCTNCGPRYSIIKGFPYDRPLTTMNKFKMCTECEKEYNSPLNRRYHAQPNACSECGPHIWLVSSRGEQCNASDPVKTTVKLLTQGKIIAIKGLGGFHLMCDAGDEQVVANLRQNKERPDKPLALMMNNITTVKKYCHLNEQEKDILTGNRKPILLLNKKESKLPKNIAPGSKYYGVMLPYTPLHYLLFNDDLKVLVATSGNISGSPIEYKNGNAFVNLKDIADYFLFHNREIYLPIDDSVVRVIMGKERIFRIARGYAPCSAEIYGLKEGLALGAEQKSTISIARGDFAFLSQHLGDLRNGDVYDNFKFIIQHFEDLYQLNHIFVAHDLHPDYQSTHYANFTLNDNNKKKVKQIGVQHHHAHIASCMAENNINNRVIGIAFDGTGLGTDGNIWGGEFLLCDYEKFKRAGHLNYIKMPGGERAIKEPWRMAVSYLYRLNYNKNTMLKLLKINKKELEIVLEMLEKDFNCSMTSSMGRLFDTVAAIIGLREKITYQAQAAIELETIAYCRNKEKYHYLIKEKEDKAIVNTDSIIREILCDYKNGVNRSIISGKFHNTVIKFSFEMCELLRSKYGVNCVALSGGVFQNEILFEGIYRKLRKANFTVYTHTRIPCNDGGLSLGQLVIASKSERRDG